MITGSLHSMAETKPKLFNNTEASGEFYYLGLKKDLCFRFANRKIFFHAVQKFFIGKRQQLTKTANMILISLIPEQHPQSRI